MTMNEFLIILLTLFGEGSVCDLTELRAIARVIEVRAEERGLTQAQVCRQPRQFSCWNRGEDAMQTLANNPAVTNSAAWARCRRVSMELVVGVLPELPRWNHYYNPTLCTPKWTAQLTDRQLVGHHVFGRLP